MSTDITNPTTDPTTPTESTTKPKHTVRNQVVLAGLGLTLVGVVFTSCSGGSSTPATTAQSNPAPVSSAASLGFNDPLVLAADIQKQLGAKLADPKDAFYQAGVTVTDVTCAKVAGTKFTCMANTSDKQNIHATFIVSPDGSSYLATGGNN